VRQQGARVDTVEAYLGCGWTFPSPPTAILVLSHLVNHYNTRRLVPCSPCSILHRTIGRQAFDSPLHLLLLLLRLNFSSTLLRSPAISLHLPRFHHINCAVPSAYLSALFLLRALVSALHLCWSLIPSFSPSHYGLRSGIFQYRRPEHLF
jgi:hypothetical protein